MDDTDTTLSGNVFQVVVGSVARASVKLLLTLAKWLMKLMFTEQIYQITSRN